MSSDDSATPADRFGLDGAVIERTTDRADVERERLVGALDVLHAELIGRHSNLERTTEYVTVDGVRAYRVDVSVWDEFLEEFDFEEEVEAALRATHTEQARLLFAKSVTGDDNFDADEAGVVISIDTAEQF
jgi:hypothetical protein